MLRAASNNSFRLRTQYFRKNKSEYRKSPVSFLPEKLVGFINIHENNSRKVIITHYGLFKENVKTGRWILSTSYVKLNINMLYTVCNVLYSRECRRVVKRRRSWEEHTDPVKNMSLCHYTNFFPGLHFSGVSVTTTLNSILCTVLTTQNTYRK